MVRNGHNVSICIWYEIVITYRSAYGTKWSECVDLLMVRNGQNVSICIWYEMVIMYFLIWFEMVICVNLHMVRNGHIMYRSAYGTKWSYNVSICILYEMVIMCGSAYGTKWLWYEMTIIRLNHQLQLMPF